jgi:alpha-L-fucosidase 2
MKHSLTIGIALLLAPLVALHAADVDTLLARCQVTKTNPTPLGNAGGYGTMNQCLLLGNGNLMVSVAGGPETLTLFLGKTDFWRDRGHGKGGTLWQSGNVLPGWLNLACPAMKDARFEQVQDLLLAELRTKLTKGGDVIEVRSVTPHEADNIVINDIANKGAGTVEVRVETCTSPFSSEMDPFELSAGQDAKDASMTWVTRKTHQPPPPNKESGDPAFRMWAAVGTRVIGAATQSEATDSRATSTFTLKPGQQVRVITRVHSTGLPLTLSPPDPLPDTLAALGALSGADADRLIAEHRAWWNAFWRKGWVQLDAEPLMQRVWFGCLYVFGCANRVGQWPAGCNGWPVNDDPPWGGDYHWNYNHEATYYGAYTANRVELTEPYDRTVLDANRYGRRHAQKLGAPGTLFYMATAPGHLNEAITVGQKTHALEASLNLILRYSHTYDLDWVTRMLPFLKDVADFWDWALVRDKETRPNGTYRYVIKDSAPMEGAENDQFNGITGLAFLRRFYSAMLDITAEMKATGRDTGVTETQRALWRDILANLSDYPMSFAYGRKVFAWSEQSLNPLLTEQDWILYPVFPSEQVNLSSDPELLRVARNTLVIKPQYYVEWLNNPPQIFGIAARLAHHPPEIMERFRAYFRDLGPSHFKSGGGNVEGAGIADGIQAMLLQSQEGFLRLFPCWSHADGTFVTLRAAGAFLVSAEKKNGVVQPITILSEKGRLCSVLNPWPGKTLGVTGNTVTIAEHPFGQVCTFPTETGKSYTLAPKEPLPKSQPYWNAALYKPVTASSSYRPPKETNNWDTDKLTDGTRINTRVGHHGWSSALHDNGNHTESVQVDLGLAVPVKQVDLWPLDHGDAWQHTHCSEPFVQSDEIDQSYDGFPLDFRILVSADGSKWDEVAKREHFRKPATGAPDSDRKPRDVTGPESFGFSVRPVRFVKVEITRLRKTRYFGKYAAQLAEIEVVRTETN